MPGGDARGAARCEQAVLLAAGAGSRLLPYTTALPKCLVPVSGRAIVDHLLDALVALAVRELIVVTGHFGKTLRAHLGERRGDLAIAYVDNPAYRDTNNIYSLHLTAPRVRPPFLLLESDIYAEPAVLAPLVVPDRAAVAAFEPHMRGTGARVGQGGRIERLHVAGAAGTGGGGPGADRANGVFKTVNLWSFSRPTWAHLAPALTAWVGAGRRDVYYEAPLGQLVAERRVALTAVDVTGLRWAEIDDADDLRRAERLAARASA